MNIRAEFVILFSFVTHFFKSCFHRVSESSYKSVTFKQSVNILEYAILKSKGVYLSNFTLFHYDNALIIDLLIFLPHHGLYFGEKISWTAAQLKGAKVESSTKKSSTTHLKIIQAALHQKLEDVLSFDSTPIERFFWMENLYESDFDKLDTSFHRLLSKERLIFADNDIKIIQEKLFSLSSYQKKSYSKLKILGSLQAHSLLLPSKNNPFGAFLSAQQQAFLNAPIVDKSITILSGDFATGKSTVLIRKVLHSLLHNDIKVAIITPTVLSGELLRKELIAICEFSAITLNYSRIQFLSPPIPEKTITLNTLSKDISLIVYDDLDTTNALFMNSLNKELQRQMVIISTSNSAYDEHSHHLTQVYRIPIIKTIHCTESNEELSTLLTEIRKIIQTRPSSLMLILLESDEEIARYKKAIDEHLHIESSVITTAFSLQYQNIDSITLSKPLNVLGICVDYCFVINIDVESKEYKIALSRSSKNITLISSAILTSSIL